MQPPIRISTEEASKHSTIRAFKLEPAEERNQFISKFLVWRDSVSDMLSVNLLGILASEPCEDEETPAISRAATYREKNSASARNPRILIPDVSVKRSLNPAFNSVSRSVAS